MSGKTTGGTSTISTTETTIPNATIRLTLTNALKQMQPRKTMVHMVPLTSDESKIIKRNETNC